MAGRDIARSVLIAERRTKAVQLRLAGHTWDTIATQCGYSSGAAACKDVIRVLRQTLDKQKLAIDELREQELQHLYALRQRAWEVMQRRHVHVSGGTVVRDWAVGPDGEPDYTQGAPEPLEDDGPTLQAIDRLVRIEQQIAKLTGIEAPQVVETGGRITYDIVGVDMTKLT